MGLLDYKEELNAQTPVAGEDELQTAFKAWKQQPDQAASARMLEVMQPTIDRAAKAQTGRANEITAGKARAIALQSLSSYDPAKGKLTSHLYNHMQGLKRYVGQTTSGIRVPERLMLDRKHMEDAHNELTAELGREPNDDELANRTGINSKRLRQSRNAPNAMSSGFFSQTGENGTPFDPAVTGGHSDAWNEAIYDDLNDLDKKVFEFSLGYKGAKVLQNQEIARKLRRSPGWVSQRKLVIQKSMDAAQGLNPF